MQGIVFTYRKRKQRDTNLLLQRKTELKTLFKKWGSIFFFAFMLIVGLLCGCITAGKLSAQALNNLDFLFTTNLPQRLTDGALNAFCAGFASDFLFLLAAFLMGLSLWGAALLPFIAFFKGFGVGVSAGYLLMTYGLKGIVFYLAVLLPGIIVFSMALIYQLSSAYYIFKRVFLTLFAKSKRGFKEPFNLYLKSGLKYLMVTFAASVLDYVLWICLSGLFFK